MKIGIIGTGWRAQGYMKVIRLFSHRMEVSAVLAHSEKSAQEMELYFPGKVERNLEEFLKRDYDFVMVLVPGKNVLLYIEKLMEKGIPVLSETPPGYGVEELEKCWKLKEKYHGKIQVAEQCHLRPYYQAVLNIIERGCLGEVSNMFMGMLHDYHAVSLMRKVLHVGFENCTIYARQYDFPVQHHCGREGLHRNGKENIVHDRRKRGDFIFESGKTGFYDFSDEQYFNYFRTRHMNVRGTLGEIYDFELSYLGEDGLPSMGRIGRDDPGQFENLEGCTLRSLYFNGKTVYENPYWKEGVRLSDDEIAMAGILDGMKRYADGGEEIYSLQDALQDTYLYLSMDEAIKKEEPVSTRKMCWTNT